MKASEEIAVDAFIKKCIRNGNDNRYEIVEMAKKVEGNNAAKVKKFLQNGKSISYEEHIGRETCINCGSDMMFDEMQSEYYCPICD